MSNKANKTTKTARAAYHQHQSEISAKLEELTKRVTEHAMKKPLEAINWADAGDLAKVNSDLGAILEFLK